MLRLIISLSHERVVQNILRVDSVVGTHAQHLQKHVEKVFVAQNLLVTAVVAFFQEVDEDGWTLAQNLLLALENLHVVTTCDAEESVIDHTVSFNRGDSAL